MIRRGLFVSLGDWEQQLLGIVPKRLSDWSILLRSECLRTKVYQAKREKRKCARDDRKGKELGAPANPIFPALSTVQQLLAFFKYYC